MLSQSVAARVAATGTLFLAFTALEMTQGQIAEAQTVPGPTTTTRIVHADVVALDQMLVYNRFGSHNPFGMMFALRRDVAAASSDPKVRPDADRCGELTGAEAGEGQLVPGRVMLKPCKRPRPLVLRGNVGDILQVTVTNLLRPDQPDYSSGGHSGAVGCKPESKAGKGASHSAYPPARFCREGVHTARGAKATTRCEIRTAVKQACRARDAAAAGGHDGKAKGRGGDWPATRTLSFAIPGLEPLPIEGKVHPACLGMDAVRPGEAFSCRWRLDREGTHLFSSLAAPSGGQADGGSLMHGLFGGLIIQASNSTYYRSQVTKAAFEEAWPSNKKVGTRHAREEVLGYTKAVPDTEAVSRKLPQPGALKFQCTSVDNGNVPLLAMTRACSETLEQAGFPGKLRVDEIVHGDLNAIIVPGLVRKSIDAELAVTSDEDERTHLMLEREKTLPFREFTVIFHDEIKTFYTDHFRELDQFDQLSGIRDGFAINYGASGAGSLVLANRKKIGPAANCPECMYEEFFLESWASGDPALLEAFPDDPANVHHSYLNDKVVFRNFHAGKETHVFHLHAHQWMAGNDLNRGGYLDSQTIGPQQGLTYRIYHGGHDRFAPQTASAEAKGWWESLGSGNRNRTIGDSIFHCHLYPHFAQGMWALWRVHDVLEDGTRVLPDGQAKPGLSLEPLTKGAQVAPRLGSVLPKDGSFQAGGSSQGTPVPGLIPLPDAALPLLPTYGTNGMPGYPFYIAGSPGHRAPQPPLDMATDAGGNELNGGLPRHVVTAGEAIPTVQKKLDAIGAPSIPDHKLVAAMLAVGDVTSKFKWLTIKPLDQAGELLEKNAMAFHYNGRSLGNGQPLELRNAFGSAVNLPSAGSFIAYPSPSLSRTGSRAVDRWFAVNGAPPAPGAPFSDPCGVPAGLISSPHRRVGTDRKMSQDGKFPTTDGLRSPKSKLADLPFVGDPALTGFRRYEASVIQFDMVVNRAGWHDPQARINVLTDQADQWKLTKRSDAEPFFFRAFSGECIEFRHTNETPKDLELDDFQLKVPTDIIGQHIHLVKFDVTSADGSGNGFNYEDGTFAPDEILARICAIEKAIERGKIGALPPGVADRKQLCAEHKKLEFAYYNALKAGDEKAIAKALAELKKAELWRKSSRKERQYFQTTVQRWFADPILSNDGQGGIADRTLRTVFTHDHFAPSNIQQHGFYNALLIEPRNHVVCLHSRPEKPDEHARQFTEPSKPTTCVGEPPNTGAPKLSEIDPRDLVGTRASVLSQGTPDPIHPDTREYAIAIADFATLYDGARGAKFVRGVGKVDNQGEIDGLRRLYLEAAGRLPKRHADDAEDSVPPASVSRPDYRLGRELAVIGKEIRHKHGYPIAAPPRPESISQKHHDPYLVNYRNEPIPLRIGAKRTKDGPVDPKYLANPCNIAVTRRTPETEHYKDIKVQRRDNKGDMGHVFRSAVHGDPCTPIIESYENENVQVRLIQGAQEVQHTFMIEGRTFPRNKDQAFPAARLGVDHTTHGTRADNCTGSGFAGSGAGPAFGESGRPLQFDIWTRNPNYPPQIIPEGDPRYAGTPHAYWRDFANHASGCNSSLGLVTANEIGISEHFEIGGRFDSTGNARAAFRNVAQAQTASNRVLKWGLRRAADGKAVLGVEEGEHPLSPNTAPGNDTLYHFGSQDALWNGAFGLVRTYDLPGASHVEDVARCYQEMSGLASAEMLNSCWKRTKHAVAQRLPTLAALQPAASSGAEKLGKVLTGQTTTPVCRVERPLSANGSEWREGTRVVVAAHGEEIWPGHFANKHGSNRIYDPDALVLVELTNRDWFFRDGDLKTEVKRAHEPARRTRREIVDHLANQVKREGRAPSPLVLRAKAGDCIVVWVVNALKERPANSVGTIRDNRGDALMPKIVPLNVEAFGTARNSNSSANVALSIPLPVIAPNALGELNHLPFGINGADDHRLVGPARSDDKPPRMRATRYLAQIIRQQDLPQLDGRNIGDVVELGVPYAYGVLPIRAVGDVIGHAAHGMYGSIIIEPAGGNVKPEMGDAANYAKCHGDKGCRIEHPEINFVSTPPTFLGTSYAKIPGTVVREHVVVYEDGLNLWSRRWDGGGPSPHPLPNCPACDDSYDLGEKGANYRTEPFNRRLAGSPGNPSSLGLTHASDDKTNLNQHRFPGRFFSNTYRAVQTPRLQATPGEETMVRVVHPSGRARQRAFVLYGTGYFDMFPGFGSANSTLLAPGKAITASFCAPKAAGEYLWRDGPQHIFAAGVWGHLYVVEDARGALGLQCRQ